MKFRLPVAPAIATLVLALGFSLATGLADEESLNPELKDRGEIRVKPIDWDQIDDPGKDGWAVEEFNQLAGKQLKKLGTILTTAQPVAPDAVASLIGKTFRSNDLIPASPVTVFQDETLVVTRSPGGPHEGKFEGFSGFAKVLEPFSELLTEASGARSKFKIFRVNRSGTTVQSEIYFDLAAQFPDRQLEQHALWEVTWSWDGSGSKPRILAITASRFEQSARSGPAWFADCTGSILKDTACYQPQLLAGYGHWLGRIPHGIYLESMGSPGIALGDVNGDGLDDFYLCQERGLPNRLFLQQADGTAREVSAAWGVDWLESSRSALLVDFDNDGDQDLAVAVMGGVVLASNEDNRSFQFRTLLISTEDTMSLAAADYDHDGDADLFVCGYYADKSLDSYGDAGGDVLPTAGEGFVMHDANTGGKSHLFRNDLGSPKPPWSFTDVTEESGLEVNNRRFSFGASWEDFDNDGDQDIYIANDFGRDNLYRNDGGTFTDISSQANIEDSGTGMGITWGDFNRDGYMDAYVSNMFSSAGNRVTYQDQFKPGADPRIKSRIQQLARGNTVLQNTGKGTFLDISSSSGAEMGRWSWGALFADLNNDGWEDLIASNGYITAEDTGDL